MEVDRECSVCQEEAPMFCRMCNLHYCPDHLCLHLNVAWETNTWTKRNSNDSERIRNTDDTHIQEYVDVQSEQRNEEGCDLLQNPPKSILSYTETQLQEQYNFYLSQARRIRTELERRAVSLAGAPSGEEFKNSWQIPHIPKPKSKRGLGKSATSNFELLLDKLRAGHISYEQIVTGIAQMSTLGAAKKQGRS